jgi:hypothetical protein
MLNLDKYSYCATQHVCTSYHETLLDTINDVLNICIIKTCMNKMCKYFI